MIKFQNYWPAPPHNPQGIRAASGFEFSVFLSVCLFVCLSVCLCVCLLVLGKFSNLFVDYKAAGVRKNVVRKNVENYGPFYRKLLITIRNLKLHK